MQTKATIPGIDPGEFRSLVTLLVPTLASDASGTVATYAAGIPPTTAWVKIKQLRGTDIVKSGQEMTQVVLELTGWYRAAFKAQCRIQAPSGSVYIIQAVENVAERNEFMRLICLGIGANN